MPLPFVLGAAAAVAGLTGLGTGIHGAVKMKEANDTMKSADSRHKQNLAKFEDQNKKTNGDMDKLGSLELKILQSFETFAKVFEKIQNKPEFKAYQKNGVNIPQYNGEELKKVSVGAGVLLGGIGGAALGTARTAIASLSGAAATNATLAALGGGAIAAGGGGIALGTTILGAATLGVGLLVGGVIFNFTGSSLSDKADEAWAQMKRAEEEIDRACSYMRKLSGAAVAYTNSLNSVNRIYQAHLKRLQGIVDDMGKTDWNTFTPDEKLCTENSVLLVGLLYNMCKVQLVQKAETEGELNRVNKKEVYETIEGAKEFLSSHDFSPYLKRLIIEHHGERSLAKE